MNSQTAEAIRELEAYITTVDDSMALPREAAEFLHTIILATRARRGLEVGTSYGYSGLWIAAALAQNDGTLATIDREERKSNLARVRFESAGLHDVVNLRTGVAADVLVSLSGPFDFVLLDADKENCRRYVELLTDKLCDRAVIVTDNTTTHADELATFLAWIRAHPGYDSTGIAIGNGMELSVRRSAR